MLEEPPLLTVRRGFGRPTPAQLEAFVGAQTGWIVDAQNGRAALGAAIKPLFPGVPGLDRCMGTAVTCWCGPNDNLAIVAALAIARRGDVIIASTEGFTKAGHIGDLVAGMMRNKGIAGFVTDGAVRNIVGLREMGLPVFAAAVTPDSCVRSGPGMVGQPIVIGGRRIDPGDIVVADLDGVTTVPLTAVDEVMRSLDAVKRGEAQTLERVRGGMLQPPWIEELMGSDKVRFLD
jgi:4-hydroxy-4-methyl-2-oxoglutarate aldolase